jgi:hypothetical protein
MNRVAIKEAQFIYLFLTLRVHFTERERAFLFRLPGSTGSEKVALPVGLILLNLQPQHVLKLKNI